MYEGTFHAIVAVLRQIVQLVQMIQFLGKGGDDMIEINPTSSQPIFEQIIAQIKMAVLKGLLKPGDSILIDDGLVGLAVERIAVCDAGDGGKSIWRAGAAASDRDNSRKRCLYRRDGKDTAFGEAERTGKAETKRSLCGNDLSWFFQKRDSENGGRTV